MRRLWLTLALAAFFVSSWQAAHAAASDSPRGRFALGIIVGEPTGLSLKLRTGDRNALDGAVAWSLDDFVELHIHGDFLRHTYDAVDVDGTVVPAYYGIGFRLRLNEGSRDDDIGIRFPLGLAWVFANGGLETFIELAPVLDLAPDTDLDINAAVGLRYVFGHGRNASTARRDRGR